MMIWISSRRFPRAMASLYRSFRSFSFSIHSAFSPGMELMRATISSGEETRRILAMSLSLETGTKRVELLSYTGLRT